MLSLTGSGPPAEMILSDGYENGARRQWEGAEPALRDLHEFLCEMDCYADHPNPFPTKIATFAAVLNARR